MKRPVQSHRQQYEVSRAAADHEHGSLLEMIECPVCERNPSAGRIVDMEQRHHYKAEPLPWNSKIRERETFIPGMDT